MYRFEFPIEEFIKGYTGKNNRCRNLKEYPIEIQTLTINIYKICRRILLNPVHISTILDNVLLVYDNLKDEIKKRKEQINDMNKEIEELNKIIENKKDEVNEFKGEMSLTNIANYLGVTRQTIYNLKKKHSSE